MAYVGEDLEQLELKLLVRKWAIFIAHNIHQSWDPVIPLLGNYPREMKTNVQKNTYTWIFIVNLFMVFQICE